MSAAVVELVEPCPACGTLAVWQGIGALAGNGTVYRIRCWVCDDPTTPTPPPLVAAPEPPPIVPERLHILRQLQCRHGWAT